MLQGNCIFFRIQPEIRIHLSFGLTDINYDRIKYKISGVNFVEYNTNIGGGVINNDGIEKNSQLSFYLMHNRFYHFLLSHTVEIFNIK